MVEENGEGRMVGESWVEVGENKGKGRKVSR